MNRAKDAQSYYEQGLRHVKTTPPPKGQKFLPGQRVHISKNLGSSMSHFECDKDATILYTYAHAYGGDDVKSYALNVDGIGDVAWYDEHQLTAL